MTQGVDLCRTLPRTCVAGLLIGFLAALTPAGGVLLLLVAWFFWVIVFVVGPVSLLLAAQARAGILQAFGFALALAVGLLPSELRLASHSPDVLHVRDVLALVGFAFLAGLCIAPVYLLVVFALRQERERWRTRHRTPAA